MLRMKPLRSRGGAAALALSCMLAFTGTQAYASDTRDVIYVGNNWEGMIDVVDAETYMHLGRINGIPDKRKRMMEILFNPVRLVLFKAVRYLSGEGNDQFVDGMYSTQEGKLLDVAHPRLAQAVASA